MKAKDGGLAFPGSRRELGSTALGHGPNWVDVAYPGMTLRDYFAAKAMPETIRLAVQASIVDSNFSWPRVAEAAYRVADAMLAEREKGGTK